jgi:hypothetical protein
VEKERHSKDMKHWFFHVHLTYNNIALSLYNKHDILIRGEFMNFSSFFKNENKIQITTTTTTSTFKNQQQQTNIIIKQILNFFFNCLTWEKD